MDKTYVTPFDWDFVDDNTLVYDSNSSKSDEEIKQMINEALSEALEDTLDTAVDGAVDEAISNMDIKLEGENLLYKLVVNGSENGEINIPKDQFLKSVSYDSENKKLVFVMETAEGDAETEVSVSDLVASIEDGVGEIQGKLTQIDEKDSAQDAAIADKADASALENLATKEEVQAVDAKVDALEIPSIEGLAKSADVTAEIAAAVENKADKSELETLAVKTEVTEEINSAVDGLNAAIADKADASALENLATKEEVQAVDAKLDGLEIPSIEGLAKSADVTAEIATAVADKADASALETLATKEEVQAVDAKVDAIVIPDVTELATKEELENAIAPLAVKAEVTEEINSAVDGLNTAIADKADKTALETLATKEEVQAVDAKVDALEIPSIEGLAVKSEVTEEINAVSSALADFESQIETAMNAKADASALDNLATKEEVQAIDTKIDALEIPSIEGLAKSADVTAEIAAAVENKADKSELEPLATKEELTNKVDWTESTPGRKHIVLKNHDSLLGTATDGTTYNVAMVSKWDVADFGSAQLHLNLNTKDGVATINDNKNIATEDYVSAAIDGLAKSADVTTEIAAAVAPLATKSEIADKANVSQIPTRTSELVNDSNFITEHQSLEEYAKKTFVGEKIAEVVGGAPETLDTLKEIADALKDNATMAMVSEAISTKANAEDVYDKTEVYNKQESDERFQASGDYVPVEQYNDLKARLENLEIMLSVYNAEREAQMDEIISNMSSDNKEVVTDTLMESIVVPETTVAYTITAPLTDNSTVELTSPKYMTLINTSKEPVSTTISHTYAEGETTAATSVYLVGDFDTLTLENISPSVKSGYDAASVKNVVIGENNVKNLSLALDFQDGATITNNSDKEITINNKNNSEVAMTIVAPNSTVTLSNGQFTTLNAEVSDNTLIIKKNVHIGNLNLTKGNAIVEVARAEEVAGIVENYTVAEGYSVSHRVYHITNENPSKLGGVGEMILDEDITRTSSIVAPLAPAYDAVWNLNGHNITVEGTPKSGVYLNRYASNLEVNGEGVIRCEGSYGLWNAATTGKIIINDGVTIEAQTHAVYAEKGVIEINGGTFKLTNWADAEKDVNGNLKFLINCYDANYKNGSANIIVKGGKFYDFNPAESYGEPNGPVSFVAEGYGSVMTTEIIDGVEHKVYEVKPIN